MLEPARLDRDVHPIRREGDAARRIVDGDCLRDATARRVEAHQRSVTPIRHPDLVTHCRYALRLASDWDYVLDHCPPRIDLGDGAVRAIRHPDGVGTDGNGTRLAADPDRPQDAPDPARVRATTLAVGREAIPDPVESDRDGGSADDSWRTSGCPDRVSGRPPDERVVCGVRYPDGCPAPYAIARRPVADRISSARLGSGRGIDARDRAVESVEQPKRRLRRRRLPAGPAPTGIVCRRHSSRGRSATRVVVRICDPDRRPVVRQRLLRAPTAIWYLRKTFALPSIDHTDRVRVRPTRRPSTRRLNIDERGRRRRRRRRRRMSLTIRTSAAGRRRRAAISSAAASASSVLATVERRRGSCLELGERLGQARALVAGTAVPARRGP